jgi:subtilisin family serine protease
MRTRTLARHRYGALATAGLAAVSLLATSGAVAMPATAPGPAATPAHDVRVIVRETPDAGRAPETAVRVAGGRVDRRLGLIGGFSATIPAGTIGGLRRTPGVLSVTTDAPLQLTSDFSLDGRGPSSRAAYVGNGTDEVQQYAGEPGSMTAIAQQVTGAGDLWDAGITGKGVDIALIDSGIVPVDGLRGPDKVIHGPDLSFEAEDCRSGTCVPSPAQHLDSFGHGTHMAGIIGGRDDSTPSRVRSNDDRHFLGMAPDARIVSVKVADATGATDVSQVIAGIDWVIRHRHKDGLDIKVLNLSFGTDGVQDYQLDPLSYAAEVAWHQGIVVVVAAGNAGYGSAKLNDPAYNPWVIAVGAADGGATEDVSDDVVPEWSSTGDGTRNPDLVAPGRSLLSLRDPGSLIDTAYPTARYGSRFFRGSGTSQAAAVVAGAAALLVQQRPKATPDEIKALLTRTARPLPAADASAQGSGLLDLRRAAVTKTPTARQKWARATGTGSLEAARGTHHVVLDGQALTGEVDVVGHRWTGLRGFARLWAGQTWDAHTWDAHTWGAHTWDAHTWDAHTWDAHTWDGHTWDAHTWDAHTWDAHTWDGLTWSGSGWPGPDEQSATPAP